MHVSSVLPELLSYTARAGNVLSKSRKGTEHVDILALHSLTLQSQSAQASVDDHGDLSTCLQNFATTSTTSAPSGTRSPAASLTSIATSQEPAYHTLTARYAPRLLGYTTLTQRTNLCNPPASAIPPDSATDLPESRNGSLSSAMRLYRDHGNYTSVPTPRVLARSDLVVALRTYHQAPHTPAPGMVNSEHGKAMARLLRFGPRTMTSRMLSNASR